MAEPWKNHGKRPGSEHFCVLIPSAEAALYEYAIVSIFFLAMVFKFPLESNEGLTQHK
jgi:hypothetical protein